MGSCRSAPQELSDVTNNGNTNNDEPLSQSATDMMPITVNHLDFKLANSIQNGLYGSLSSSRNRLQTPPFQFNESRTSLSKSVQDECAERFDHKLNTDNKEENQEIFSEYAPEIFSRLRKAFNITDNIYLSILTGDNNELLSFLSNSKSGQYFFFSNNCQFIIKTMSKSELDFLLQILPSYYEYMLTETNSLIAKFYGVYKLNKFRINNSNKDISFLISNNVFYSPTNMKIVEKYDLKGSTQGRKAEFNEILKDLNFIQNDVHLEISTDNKAKLFHQQINTDCEWFSSHLIMDYSLLVGIADVDENMDKNMDENNKNKSDNNIFYDYCGGVLSDNEKQIYFIGIIDILQKYNKKKKLAGFVKGIKYEQITLSTVPPDMYARRFCDFFKDRVL